MIKTILISLLASSVMMAASLTQEAKDAGLVAIPTDVSELLKLTQDPKNKMTAQKIKLGKMLYFEPRISKSGLISCNTCHNLATGGDDGLAAARGHKWSANPHHLGSPTVYNAVFFERQFWDGRSPSLEDQAKGPMVASVEMAASPKHIVDTVVSMPEYVALFKQAYGKNVDISYENIAKAIGLFERTLVTPAPFDDFLNGDKQALSVEEKAGLHTFIEKGCASCHNGIALGGSMNAFEVTAKYKYRDIGDFKGDANGMVKVPTLRNITQTAPYFHNGQEKTLKEAIVEMGRIQLGVAISDKEAASIETFLGSLKGRKPSVTYPILPTSTATTPKPDVK